MYFIPQNYRGQTGDSLEDCAVLNGYPTISYRQDTFNSWLAQNSQIINIQKEQMLYNLNKNYEANAVGYVTDALSGILSAFNPMSIQGVGNSIASMSNRMVEVDRMSKNYEYDIANINAQVESHKLVPDQVSLSSSNATLLGYDKIHKNIFCRYNIKSQFAQRIDKYFDMFGYQTNTVKTPNINNRPKWNYVKTIGCNIEAYIPQEDLSEIKSFFDNGITLWHDTSNFLNYSANNRS